MLPTYTDIETTVPPVEEVVTFEPFKKLLSPSSNALPILLRPRVKGGGGDCKLNVAVQVLAAVMVTDPLLLQSPVHPVKVEPEAGTAESVTWVPLL